MDLPDHLTCLLRNLYAGQEATLRTRHGIADWFEFGKGVHQGYILSPWLFNLYVEYIMWNAGLDKAQAGIKIVERNINNFRYADDTTLMAESEEELKSLLMKLKEESHKAVLKPNIQKMRIMASDPIFSWKIDRQTMETVTDFLFLGSKISIVGDCSHENKRCLFLGRKNYDKLDSISRSRNIALLTKFFFPPVVTYACENWTIKKAEHWRVDGFRPWCWRRLLRVHCSTRRSSQSILKEINFEYLLEVVMLKHNSNTLATWCKEQTH